MSQVRVRYSTYVFGEQDIHLRTLRDVQQFEDGDGVAASFDICSSAWPLFGVVWESGEILARLMYHHDIRGLRILEVGCGIGLASLVLSQRDADVTATDHHPEAALYLHYNAGLNGLRAPPFVRAGWADPADGLGRFNLIVGSDLLYDATWVERLADFIHRHAEQACEILIVDPGRGNEARFRRRLIALGYRHDSSQRVDPVVSTTFTGRIHRYSRGPPTSARTDADPSSTVGSGAASSGEKSSSAGGEGHAVSSRATVGAYSALR